MFLNDLDPDWCANNTAPGLTVVEYAPLPSVDLPSYEEALRSGNQQRAVVAEWHRLPFLPGTGRWSENSQRPEQGQTFEVSVTAVLPGDSPSLRAELDRMGHFRFLLRIRHLASTAQTLIGTLEQPLEFGHGYDSGTSDGADGRQHSITFKGVALRRNPGYTPVF